MKKPLILIADDDMDDRFLLKSAFEESGDQVEIHFVENGVEVLNYLESIAIKEEERLFPDIIILDLNMPKKSGKEVLTELKHHPVFKKITVIIYTTTKSEVEIKRCYELGANTYIVKPDTFDAIKEVVWSIKKYWLFNVPMPC